MSKPDDRLYHAERARAELDAAYRAERPDAATAHLKRCSLHMRRARAAIDDAPPPVVKELDWIEQCAPFHEKCLVRA